VERSPVFLRQRKQRKMPDSMDWVKANVRSCDECGRETDAGEWPDWPMGICEECDPDIFHDYFDCNDCGLVSMMQFVSILRVSEKENLLLCSICFVERKEKIHA